ncbi:MAG: mercuric reductase [Planctomycetota bacterium]|nr:MAG: mercuric reductase [Planctomycetota bacterium]
MAKGATYAAVVIGTGQGGVPLAKALAEAGWKTAIVEKEAVGGTCINYGCTPTKTMVASARVAYLARRAADYGVRTGTVAVDLARVRRRKRALVRQFRAGSEAGLRSTRRLHLLFGTASFAGPHELRVRSRDGAVRLLRARHVFINVGCRPRPARVPGIESVRTLDSTSIMELDRAPRHLAILGGGYVGIEFGQMFRRFGSAVTILDRGSHLLDREDEDVSAGVEEVLRGDGVKLLLRAEVDRIGRTAGGRIALAARAGRRRHRVVADQLLVATGREPNTHDLDAEAAGITLDERGFVVVNDRLETSVPGVYALGDVTGGPAFTHISWDDHRILEANLLHGGDASTRGRLVPYTVYLDPQLGRVGMSEREARASGRRVRVATLPMAHVARALEMDETRGFLKVIVDAHDDRILGAAVLGVEGGEIMSAISIAMMAGLPYPRLRDGIFAHPTLMEALNNLFFHLTDAE